MLFNLPRITKWFILHIKKLYYSIHKTKEVMRLEKENIVINETNKEKEKITKEAKKEILSEKEKKIEAVQKMIIDTQQGGIQMNNESVEKIDMLINQNLENETLIFIRDNPDTTSTMIQEHLGVSHTKSDKVLDRLINDKKIDYKNKGYVTTIKAQENFDKKEERTDNSDVEFAKTVLKNSESLTTNMETETITKITTQKDLTKNVEPIRETSVVLDKNNTEKSNEKSLSKTDKENVLSQMKTKTNDTRNDNIQHQIIEEMKKRYKTKPTGALRIEVQRMIAKNLSEKAGSFSISMIIRIMKDMYKSEINGKDMINIQNEIEKWLNDDYMIKKTSKTDGIQYYKMI